MKNPLPKINLKALISILLVFTLGYIIRINLAVVLLLSCLYFYLNSRKLINKSSSILSLTLLFLVMFVSSYFLIKHQASIYFIPFCVLPIITTLLFSSIEISLIISLAYTLAIAPFSNMALHVIVFSLISAISSSILTLNARKRSTIIRAGIITGIIQVTTLVFLENFTFGSPGRYLTLFINGIASSMIVLGILPVFEYLFNTATNISLLELADFHHPLLQRLAQEAPGTYHHSLIVGNLSETASSAVGANALLARIGAYYHDVGKLQKPEYFSENQDREESRHNKLAPTMSKLVIMNHVKEGLELAKKYRLNPALVNFIQQHHGKSLVYYFYRRALENVDDYQEVSEEGFRYPGPKPNSKETAIVLLADSVEAAARALRESSPAKIEELVHKIINNKFIDGQLDECDLTLKDLEKISAVFIRLLCGAYHSRVNYPQDEPSEDNPKKSAKENTHLSAKDKKNNP